MKIEPALTKEEWAGHGDVFDGWVDLDMGIIDVRFGGPAGIRDESRERHALAAKLLRGQPFGFTREDVEAIREHVGDGISMEPKPIPTPGAEALWDIAARIEALLPPEEK